jgi:exopolyphosphatase/guanosine-5'-triphosphate,3'-diphosphate pyrophosphatase
LRVATFDVGTNTVLASVVAQSAAGTLELVSDRAIITRLGAGVDHTRRLDPRAVTRTLAAIDELARAARADGATRLLGVGTSALRDAIDRDAFVVPARRLLDRFDVIDGRREAALTFAGAFFGLETPQHAVSVVDIGGGSTEIVRGRSGRVESGMSLDVGSVRLYERHLTGIDPPSADALRAVRADIERALGWTTIPLPLVMLAGTATNVAAVALGRDLRGGARQPHGERVSRAAIRDAVARITSASRDARRAMIGIEPGREDVLVAGAQLLEAIMLRASADEILISDGGVRLGLAIEALVAADRRPPEAC